MLSNTENAEQYLAMQNKTKDWALVQTTALLNYPKKGGGVESAHRNFERSPLGLGQS